MKLKIFLPPSEEYKTFFHTKCHFFSKISTQVYLILNLVKMLRIFLARRIIRVGLNVKIREKN